MPEKLQSIERAAAVVRLLAAGSEPQPLRDIAQMLRLPKSTAHGIVRTLVMVGGSSRTLPPGDMGSPLPCPGGTRRSWTSTSFDHEP